ncbi:hypothetical protein FALBO_2426 [Fusarium albosuccineum]|uniref:DUF7053 domain-containing protein n=2 Tax=Fusarium decemcellulare species complex TaxID=1329916 RepID=A0A8H4PCM5_9HYPO|nr:hypothetical protein FALBO_2426 [Fusarium albosuccineum]
MRTQHHLSIATPIPGNVPPGVVVAAIQTYTPLIRHHSAMTGFDEVSATPDVLDNDPFFGPWDDSVRAFQLRELITLAPGLTKEITYQTIFQLVPDGTRSRAMAPAGIVVRAEFTVRQRRATTVPISPAGSDSTASGSTVTAMGDEYELREEVLVEANSLLMPFITEALATVHRGICERVVVETAKNYFGTGDMQ